MLEFGLSLFFQLGGIFSVEELMNCVMFFPLSNLFKFGNLKESFICSLIEPLSLVHNYFSRFFKSLRKHVWRHIWAQSCCQIQGCLLILNRRLNLYWLKYGRSNSLLGLLRLSRLSNILRNWAFIKLLQEFTILNRLPRILLNT